MIYEVPTGHTSYDLDEPRIAKGTSAVSTTVNCACGEAFPITADASPSVEGNITLLGEEARKAWASHVLDVHSRESQDFDAPKSDD